MRLPVFPQPFKGFPSTTESLNTMLVERAPENDTQDESTFSAASMFGMLLTLSLCLLLQPQGNLIVKKPSNVFGRVLFFFLRLNPVMCFVEGIGIFHALVLILWRAIRSCHGNLYRDFGVFITNLNAGAAALLFLRSHNALQPQPRDTDPRLNQILVGPVPQRGHIEMLLDVVTLLSMVVTTIKLIASVVPAHFQTISWSYIAGWIMVHLAVMISHIGPSKELLDSRELLRSARYLHHRVTGLGSVPIWLAMMMVVLVQMPGLFSYTLKLSCLDIFGVMCYSLLVCSSASFFFLDFGYSTFPKRSEAFVVVASLINLLGAVATIAIALVRYEEEGPLSPRG